LPFFCGHPGLYVFPPGKCRREWSCPKDYPFSKIYFFFLFIRLAFPCVASPPPCKPRGAWYLRLRTLFFFGLHSPFLEQPQFAVEQAKISFPLSPRELSGRLSSFPRCLTSRYLFCMESWSLKHLGSALYRSQLCPPEVCSLFSVVPCLTPPSAQRLATPLIARGFFVNGSVCASPI